MANTKNLDQAEAKMPPQNLQAEASLLGSLMLDKDAIIKVADVVHGDDFYAAKNKLIFDAILALYEKRDPLDVVTLSNKLETMGELENIGGATYLTSLVNGVPSAAHVENYAKIVAQKATLRRLISAANDIGSMAYDEDKPLDGLLDNAEQRLFDVSQKHLKQNFTSMKEVLAESFDRLDSLHKDKGKLRGLPTGFRQLDNVLAGLQKSDLIILAARPAMGKSTFALNIAQNIAIKQGVPVGVFSLEMSKEQLVDRLLAAEAGIDSWRLRTGNLEDKDFEKLNKAMGVLAEAPIYFDDSGMLNVMEMRTKARRLQSEHDLGLIVIDYLQLMSGRNNGGENRVQEISEISRGLKGLARELNIPVLALSQLSRAVESRSPQIPQLSDLRESGSIEQDADVVMFIYRDEYYHPQDTEKPNTAEIIIAKHRNGPTGHVDLYFNAEEMRFKNLDKSHTQH